MKEFANFIDDSLLIDVQCTGKRFTKFSGDDKFMSRIDRLILSDEAIHRCRVVGLYIGERDISNHNHIWISINNSN